jgi:hypothetical protein
MIGGSSGCGLCPWIRSGAYASFGVLFLVSKVVRHCFVSFYSLWILHRALQSSRSHRTVSNYYIEGSFQAFDGCGQGTTS